jgi:hypothetical protein
MSGLTIGYLEEIGKKICGSTFAGVFPCDLHPNVKNKSVFSVIFNLSKHNQDGTHYVCLFVDKKKIIFFDPFGKICSNEDIKKFIKLHLNKRRFIETSNVIQDTTSNFCGYFCLAFLISQYQNMTTKIFFNIFDKCDLSKNNKIVTKFIINAIEM